MTIQPSQEPLDRLAILDPELADVVRQGLADAGAPPDLRLLGRLVDEIFQAVPLSIALARCLSAGGAELLAYASPEGLERYWKQVHAAAAHGPELAQLMAEFLVPVIRFADPDFAERLDGTLSVLRHKGIYTLKRPLAALAALIRRGEHPAALAFLNLLDAAFSQDLSYNQSLHLSHILPRAALELKPARRAAQLDQLRRVVATDFYLADDFLDGLAGGLGILDAEALERFVTQALAKWRRHPGFGRRMLALKTQAGRDACRALQRAAALAEVRPALGRYLAARTATRLAIRPLATLSAARRETLAPPPAVCSDGAGLYLPEEIDRETTHAANIEVFKLLVRIESGFHEYGTYDFDLQKMGGRLQTDAGAEALCDMERFLAGFARVELAEDLMTVAEQTRLRLNWQYFSPGLWRRSRPRLQEALPAGPAHGPEAVVDWLYRRLVFESDQAPPETVPPDLLELVEDSELLLAPPAPVEAAGAWVAAAYPLVAPLVDGRFETRHLETPFGWRPRAQFFGDAHRQALKAAIRLQRALREQGVDVYRSALVRRLIEKSGKLDADDLAVTIRRADCRPPGAGSIEIPLEQLKRLLSADPLLEPSPAPDSGPATWYPEWDHQAAGYLADHVRVVDRELSPGGADFYPRTLARHHGLVDRMRRAFEMLRPEAVAILRPWIEGDEFDYRALIDYAVDHRAGIPPTDRIYIKRIKSLRDVAVLLLVDLSRSTGNRVAGGGQTVVEVEKEAIVLFCEALKVVGDRFALAGFSGNGRLGVDYFHIKDFDQVPGEDLQRRIEAIAPQRATRMGAAIRHATRQLAAQAARVRLLIVLGDGFPNDVDYKGDHAVADTRQAIGEAHACGIHSHAITVNLPADARLDDLYGAVHHSLIGEVRQLPDRLLGIYGRLTR